MLNLLLVLLSVAQLVIFIMVLIKLFNEKGAGHGFLGLICAIYTFIWGWLNAARLGIKNLMVIWTVLLVAGLFLNIAIAMTHNRPAIPESSQTP